MSQVGVREMTGRNDGVEVENYLKYVNLSKGNPWCAAFVCWALGENEIENPRSGWSPDLFPKNKIIWERSKKITDLTNEMPSEVILQGDVFGIYFTDKKRIAHCGFVDQANKSWIITVEGNTNDTGGRDGDGVYRKRRLLNTIYTISSWQKQ